jgi:hypothetical protein
VSFGVVTDPIAALLSQAVPYCNQEDATAAFETTVERLLPDMELWTREVNRDEVDLGQTIGDQSRGLAVTRLDLRVRNGQRVHLVAAWRRRSCIGLVGLRGRPEQWNAADVTHLAVLQDRRILRVLEGWQAPNGRPQP